MLTNRVFYLLISPPFSSILFPTLVIFILIVPSILSSFLRHFSLLLSLLTLCVCIIGRHNGRNNNYFLNEDVSNKCGDVDDYWKGPTESGLSGTRSGGNTKRGRAAWMRDRYQIRIRFNFRMYFFAYFFLVITFSCRTSCYLICIEQN